MTGDVGNELSYGLWLFGTLVLLFSVLDMPRTCSIISATTKCAEHQHTGCPKKRAINSC